jgi:hypothetical protein
MLGPNGGSLNTSDARFRLAVALTSASDSASDSAYAPTGLDLGSPWATAHPPPSPPSSPPLPLALLVTTAAHVLLSAAQRFDWQSTSSRHGAPSSANAGLGSPSSHGACPALSYADRIRSSKPPVAT